MYAIDAHSIKRVKPGKALSGLAAEGHVMPDPFNGPAGLGPANHVAVSQVLVFEANCGLGKYPNLSHLSQRASRQGQSLPSLVARFTTSHAYLLALSFVPRCSALGLRKRFLRVGPAP